MEVSLSELRWKVVISSVNECLSDIWKWIYNWDVHVCVLCIPSQLHLAEFIFSYYLVFLLKKIAQRQIQNSYHAPIISYYINCFVEFVLCSNYFLLYKLLWNKFEFSKQTLQQSYPCIQTSTLKQKQKTDCIPTIDICLSQESEQINPSFIVSNPGAEWEVIGN